MSVNNLPDKGIIFSLLFSLPPSAVSDDFGQLTTTSRQKNIHFRRRNLKTSR